MQLRSLFATLRLTSAFLPLRAIHFAPKNGDKHSAIACRKRASGVTLIELMITISIVVITITIAVPSFQGIITRNRVASVTNQLVQSFHLARSEAIKRGRSIIICPSVSINDDNPTCDGTNWADGWIIYVDENGDRSFNNNTDTLIRVDQLSAIPVKITTIGFANNIEFSSMGQAVNEGSFSLCLVPEKRTIEISKIGRIQLKKGSCE